MMASTRFKFIKAFDFVVRHKERGPIRAIVAYPAGHEGRILEEHAKAAEAEGAGVRRLKKKADDAD
jgi:hypothetical protein